MVDDGEAEEEEQERQRSARGAAWQYTRSRAAGHTRATGALLMAFGVNCTQEALGLVRPSRPGPRCDFTPQAFFNTSVGGAGTAQRWGEANWAAQPSSPWSPWTPSSPSSPSSLLLRLARLVARKRSTSRPPEQTGEAAASAPPDAVRRPPTEASPAAATSSSSVDVSVQPHPLLDARRRLTG